MVRSVFQILLFLSLPQNFLHIYMFLLMDSYILFIYLNKHSLQLFQDADINHDGYISWEEFIIWFTESGL